MTVLIIFAIALLVLVIRLVANGGSNSGTETSELSIYAFSYEESDLVYEDCVPPDRVFVVNNSIGMNLDNFNILVRDCVTKEYIVSIKEITLKEDLKKLDYVGLGTFYIDDSNSVVRAESIISDRNESIFQEYVSLYGDYDFSFSIEDAEQIDSNVRSSSKKNRTYQNYVWLNEGIILTGFEFQNNFKENITMLSRFEKNKYDKEEFEQIFIEDSDLKFKVKGVFI